MKMKVVLVADDEVTMAKGLMGHRPLDKDECAYFYFDQEERPSFWNKNVSFPISLIFLNSKGIVEDIKYLEAEQTSLVSPDSKKIKQVIEAHKDAPEIFKIKIGSRIDFEDGFFLVEEHDDKESIQNKHSK